MFYCKSFANGQRYLNVDPSVTCDMDYMKTYYPIAVVFVVLYPIGVPLLFMWFLIFARINKHLHDPVTGEV